MIVAESQPVAQSLLSELTVFSKYGRYRPDLLRRENWGEITQRISKMHMTKFPEWALEIEECFDFVNDLRVLPSMRAAQFAGTPIELNPARLYSCAYLGVHSPTAFSEVMFLLLCGVGVGYGVQDYYVSRLPRVAGTKERTRRHVVGDSIEGWAGAIRVLVNSYFWGKSRPVFDFSDIRPKGSDLVTSGGKAPGPQPLKDCIHNLEKVLEGAVGRKLRAIEVSDMVCYMADAVLAGGIRRAATLGLFTASNIEMLTAKSGNWWELNPQRGRANLSAHLVRGETTYQEFCELLKITERSGAGEPGIVWTNHRDYGTNPCGEIAIRDMGFCNLSSINAERITGQESLNKAARAAALIGTLQATYTDFHYLREEWKTNAEDEALLGVSITGIASRTLDGLNLEEAANQAVAENTLWASRLGIKPANRVTTIKPEGTGSLVCDTASGIHGWYAPYYVRRLRFGKDELVAKALTDQALGLMVPNLGDPSQIILEYPIKAPEGAIMRTESAIDMLERVKRFNQEWVSPGHINGPNKHNVSATVSVRPEEWDDVREWMWTNRLLYTGLSLLPYDGGSYSQTPFEEIGQDEYVRRLALVPSKFEFPVEYKDETTLQAEIACGGGSCEVI